MKPSDSLKSVPSKWSVTAGCDVASVTVAVQANVEDRTDDKWRACQGEKDQGEMQQYNFRLSSWTQFLTFPDQSGGSACLFSFQSRDRFGQG